MNDHRADGAGWLTQLLALQGVNTSVQSRVVEDASGEHSHWLVIDEAPLSSEQVQSLIGEGGRVLDSIQYLANTILNLAKDKEQQQAFTVELGGYRERRLVELQQMASEAAEKAASSGEEQEIPALSSAERRQMHQLLKAYEGLETFSRGKEPDRRLVVRPAGLGDESSE